MALRCRICNEEPVADLPGCKPEDQMCAECLVEEGLRCAIHDEWCDEDGCGVCRAESRSERASRDAGYWACWKEDRWSDRRHFGREV